MRWENWILAACWKKRYIFHRKGGIRKHIRICIIIFHFIFKADKIIPGREIDGSVEVMLSKSIISKKNKWTKLLSMNKGGEIELGETQIFVGENVDSILY